MVPLDFDLRSAAATQARLFPGVTEESADQAALAVNVGGLGWRRAADLAAGAQTAAMAAADPAVRIMISGAARAGLLGEADALEAWVVWKREVRGAYLGDLEGEERGLAEAHLEHIDRWIADGSKGMMPAVPDGGALMDVIVPGGEGGVAGLGGKGADMGGNPGQRTQWQLSQCRDTIRLRCLDFQTSIRRFFVSSSMMSPVSGLGGK